MSFVSALLMLMLFSFSFCETSFNICFLNPRVVGFDSRRVVELSLTSQKVGPWPFFCTFDIEVVIKSVPKFPSVTSKNSYSVYYCVEKGSAGHQILLWYDNIFFAICISASFVIHSRFQVNFVYSAVQR